MWDIMAERHVKHGLLVSPASGGVMTLAGCSVLDLTNLCRVHSANLRTRALSCSSSVSPLNFVCGAAGSVRSANSSKSRVSSIKVTMRGSSVHYKAHRSASMFLRASGLHNRYATPHPSRPMAVCTPIFFKCFRSLAPMMGAGAMSAFFSMKGLYCCTSLSGSVQGSPHICA